MLAQKGYKRGESGGLYDTWLEINQNGKTLQSEDVLNYGSLTIEPGPESLILIEPHSIGKMRY